MNKKQVVENMTIAEFAEFIELNICNMCHFCIFYKTANCKCNEKCKEGIMKFLESEG